MPRVCSFLPITIEKQQPNLTAVLNNAFDLRAKSIHILYVSDRIMDSRKEVQWTYVLTNS
jgi:hypothetical protein